MHVLSGADFGLLLLKNSMKVKEREEGVTVCGGYVDPVPKWFQQRGLRTGHDLEIAAGKTGDEAKLGGEVEMRVCLFGIFTGGLRIGIEERGRMRERWSMLLQ